MKDLFLKIYQGLIPSQENQGKGAYGCVYKGLDSKGGDFVAIK